MIINYWIIVDNALLVSSTSVVDGQLVVDVPGASAETVSVMSDPPPPSFSALFLDPPSTTLLTYYVRGDYGSQTPLREDFQLLEDQYDGDFIVAGCWDFHTGEPVGGVGSPWFVTQPELMSFMPNGVLEQRHIMAGQGTRKFV